MLKTIENALDYMVGYRMGDDALQITTLGGAVVTRTFPYAEMLEVKKGYELWNEHYQNRFDAAKAVSIRLDRQLIPWLVVTPEDPDAFIAELQPRIKR